MIVANSYLGDLNLPDLPGTVTNAAKQLLVTPAVRTAQFAIGGAVFGGLLAATLGLAGGTVGPGNRTAILGLLAIPIAGTVAGVLFAKHTYQ
jgi:hypothetical protein